MSDEPFFSPNAKPAPVRLGKPGERLFEFRKNGDHCVCELRYHGEFGVEAQFLLNGDLYIARTFQDQPDFGDPCARVGDRVGGAGAEEHGPRTC